MIVQVNHTAEYDAQHAYNLITNKNQDIRVLDCFVYESHLYMNEKWLTQHSRHFAEKLSTIKDVRCVSYAYSIYYHASATIFEFEVDELNDKSLEEIKQVLDEIEFRFEEIQFIGYSVPGSSDLYDFRLNSKNIYYEIVKWRHPTGDDEIVFMLTVVVYIRRWLKACRSSRMHSEVALSNLLACKND